MDSNLDQYKEIIGSLKEEIDSLKDQLKHEQLKNSFASSSQHNPHYTAQIQYIDIDKPKPV